MAQVADVHVQYQKHPQSERVLTPGALAFLGDLHAHFDIERKILLDARRVRQAKLDAGELPAFLPQTADIRLGDWQISPLPTDLQDRRVEITGPVERKMIINALNSGAQVFMADFEDANSPTWDNVILGQINLIDAVKRDISLEQGEKAYRLNGNVATLFVRPRGLHLEEKHIWIEGENTSASLVDFGLYAYHNAGERLRQGIGTYFYLPKIESHLEARFWNKVFTFTENALNLPQGTLRATVLIETILAAFEMDEILYELRQHSAGLNCGRWDYIFSYIKKLRFHRSCILPDRAQVTMHTPMMQNYSRLLIQTCHKRGAPAIGGMSAFIPVKGNEAANELAFNQVRADKELEASNGHDGTWVAHPGMVALATEVFDKLMPEANQITSRKQFEFTVAAKDLLTPPAGSITEEGLNTNIDVSLQYISAWLGGRGAVPIHNLMEDVATAEISRAQLWQWAYHRQSTDKGTLITTEGLTQLIAMHALLLQSEQPESALHLSKAAELLTKLVTQSEFEDFLTVPGYKHLA